MQSEGRIRLISALHDSREGAFSKSAFLEWRNVETGNWMPVRGVK